MFKLTVAILPPCSKIRREGLLDDENWEVGEFGRGEEKHIVRNWLALVGQFSKCDVYLGCWVVGITCNQPRTMRIRTYTWEGVSSVQSLSCFWLFATPWAAAHQASLSITNSWNHPSPCPLSRWCHPTISSSVTPFSSCPQPFPASGSFQMSQLFASGGQSIGVSASTSVFPMNIQDWFPLGLTGWISLQSKGLSRVFSNTTVQKHQFFSAQLSLWSNSHIRTWPLEKT